MNLLNLTNGLALLGFIALVISLISFSKKKPEERSLIKTILTIMVGIGILLMTVIKNQKDTKSTAALESKTDSVRLLLRRIDDSSISLNQKIDTIGSLTDYIKKVEAIGIQRDVANNRPIITKTFINYIKSVGTLIQK